jgi:hypothetical protein
MAATTPAPEPVAQMAPEVPPQMDLPEPEPMYFETAPLPEPVHEEPPMMMAAAANGSPQPPEPLFDDLDVPAILRRDRRLIQ